MVYLQAPEQNPYKIANIIVDATVLIPNMARTRIPHPTVYGMTLFRAPNLSVKMLGINLPNRDSAFIIAIYSGFIREPIGVSAVKVKLTV